MLLDGDIVIMYIDAAVWALCYMVSVCLQATDAHEHVLAFSENYVSAV
jgi:hypothetical protein